MASKIKKSVDKQPDNNEGGATGKGFKKGQSGNPKGRPPKALCIPDILYKISNDKMVVGKMMRSQLLL